MSTDTLPPLSARGRPPPRPAAPDDALLKPSDSLRIMLPDNNGGGAGGGGGGGGGAGAGGRTADDVSVGGEQPAGLSPAASFASLRPPSANDPDRPTTADTSRWQGIPFGASAGARRVSLFDAARSTTPGNLESFRITLYRDYIMDKELQKELPPSRRRKRAGRNPFKTTVNYAVPDSIAHGDQMEHPIQASALNDLREIAGKLQVIQRRVDLNVSASSDRAAVSKALNTRQEAHMDVYKEARRLTNEHLRDMENALREELYEKYNPILQRELQQVREADGLTQRTRSKLIQSWRSSVERRIHMEILKKRSTEWKADDILAAMYSKVQRNRALAKERALARAPADADHETDSSRARTLYAPSGSPRDSRVSARRRSSIMSRVSAK